MECHYIAGYSFEAEFLSSQETEHAYCVSRQNQSLRNQYTIDWFHR